MGNSETDCLRETLNLARAASQGGMPDVQLEFIEAHCNTCMYSVAVWPTAGQWQLETSCRYLGKQIWKHGVYQSLGDHSAKVFAGCLVARDELLV